MDEKRRRLTGQELALLTEQLKSLHCNIDAAVVFGSAARGELQAESDVDLLVVAEDLSMLEAQAHYKPVGRAIGRPVNLVVFDPTKWREAKARSNPFVLRILASPLIPLAGELMH